MGVSGGMQSSTLGLGIAWRARTHTSFVRNELLVGDFLEDLDLTVFSLISRISRLLWNRPSLPIYKISTLLHRSELNFLEIFVQ